MNYFSKAIMPLFVFSTLLVMAFLTSCGQQAPTTSLISSTSLPSATATATLSVPTSTPIPTRTVASPTPTNTPNPTNTLKPPKTPQVHNELQRLIIVEEITTISVDIGIGAWKLEQELLQNASVCRYFFGQSWSASPNVAINCIFEAEPEISFIEAIEWLQDNQVIDPSSTALQTAYDYQGDFALYSFSGSGGHSVYDAFLFVDNLMYWASISVGTPIGYSPESLFEKYGGVIDTFLHDILAINLTKGS